MAKEYAKGFYKSRAWIKCRDSFLASKNYECEGCGGLAIVVHHKQPITPQNINDPNITLNWDNLEALCLDCHNEVHGRGSRKVIADGLMFDKNGQVVKIPPTLDTSSNGKGDRSEQQ
jgi:5-methylcytosine-specific restriction endonuclease McrA